MSCLVTDHFSATSDSFLPDAPGSSGTPGAGSRPSRFIRTGAAALVVIGLAIGSAAHAAQNTTAPASPAASPAAPPASGMAADASFTDADRSEEAVKRGTALLGEVAKAYRAAPTLSDTVKLDVVTPMGPQSEALTIEFAGKNDMRVRIPQMVITSVGDRLYVEAEQFSDEKFVGVPLKDGSISKTLDTVAEGFNLPLPQLGLRFGDEAAVWTDAFGAGSLENVAIAGHRVGEGDDDFLLLKADNGGGVARVDSKSRLLESLTVDYRPTGAAPGISIGINFAFDPKVADALVPPIAFDAKGRREVSSLDALMQKVQKGDEAPTFALADNTGATVTLEELRGQVVVLDLWATWCGPCRRGLPLLNTFAKWVKEEDKPVRVFGMNIWENAEESAAARRESALKYWNEQKFDFPTLLDLDDAVAGKYGPNGIPTTYIIDKQGKIAFIHTGFDPEMVETLKRDIATLLVD